MVKTGNPNTYDNIIYRISKREGQYIVGGHSVGHSKQNIDLYVLIKWLRAKFYESSDVSTSNKKFRGTLTVRCNNDG
jgi:hypothetical protein